MFCSIKKRIADFLTNRWAKSELERLQAELNEARWLSIPELERVCNTYDNPNLREEEMRRL